MSNMRFLLCRPEGGLNDILSEIGKCMAYCETFDRTLIVDTNYSDNEHFNCEFSKFFTTDNPAFILNPATFIDHFNRLSTRPDFIQGRVNGYRRDELWKKFPDLKERGITFDFSKDHTEQILVHHQNGRQKKRNAMVALSNLNLVDGLVSKLEERLNILQADFTAFHVRHTDYQTNFEARVKQAAPQISGPVFLATDNKDVVTFFRSVFGRERFHNFSDLPDAAGQPIHFRNDVSNAQNRNADAILDLFTLALARKYFFFPRITSGFSIVPIYSGFSSLAARLRASPETLRQVLPPRLHRHIQARTTLTALRWRYF